MRNPFHRPNRFLSQAATLAGGTATAQFISILAAPVLTRLYAPDEMGALAGLMAVVAILGVVAAGRYDQAVLLPEDDSAALGAAAAGLLVVTGVVLLLFVLLGGWGETLGPLMGLNPDAWHWALLAPVMVWLLGSEDLLIQLHVRGRRFRALASSQILQQGTASATKIGLGAGGFGLFGLFVGTLSGYLVRIGKMLWDAWPLLRSEPGAYQWANIRRQAKRYRKFPILMSGSAFLAAVSTQMPILLFTALFSSAVAGHYALGQSILGMPMALIGRNVGQIFLERAARARTRPGELSRITLALYWRLFLLGAVLLSVVAFHGDRLFPWVFGARWGEAGRYAQWMSLWLMFSFAAAPLGGLFAALERQGELLGWESGLLALRAAIIAGGFVLGLNVLPIVAVLSVASAAAYALLTLRVLRLAGMGVRSALARMLGIFLPVMGAQYVLFQIIETLR